MTKNRLQVLALLDDTLPDCGGTPPYSATSLMYTMQQQGIDYNRSAIFRTLRDLRDAGLIVRTRQQLERYNGLNGYEWAYELADKQAHNKLIKRCNDYCRKSLRAMQGVRFFETVFDWGLPPDEAAQLITEGKKLLQLTHPDKCGVTYVDEFKRVSVAHTVLKSGVPCQDAPPPIQDKQLHEKLALPF